MPKSLPEQNTQLLAPAADKRGTGGFVTAFGGPGSFDAVEVLGGMAMLVRSIFISILILFIGLPSEARAEISSKISADILASK